MAEITAQLVKELREKTSAGMMDCQRALKETNGDIEAAIDLLRKKGIAAAGKREDRDAKEGTVQATLSADGKTAAIVELNCETDFVAKNDGFRAFVDSLVAHTLSSELANAGDAAALLAGPGSDGSATLDETVRSKAAAMGERLVLRRVRRLVSGANTALHSYIHMGGKVAVVVELAAEKAESRTSDAFNTLAKDICLHICAASPEYVGRGDVPAAVVDKEMEIQKERMHDKIAGKPEAIVAKILEGTVGKFYSQICLLEQGFVKDPDQTIAQLLEASSKALGDQVSVVRFSRLALGEEIKA
jgi:elongation factor Ts